MNRIPASSPRLPSAALSSTVSTAAFTSPPPSSAPLVLLHGWAMSPAAWAPLQAELGALSTLAPALPGHGADAPRPQAPGLAGWADALAATLPQGAAGAIVVGWSLGGLLALELAHRYPERVARLVLIGASARFVADEAGSPGLGAEVVEGFRRGFATDPGATLKRFIALQCLGEADRRRTQQAVGAALAPDADRSPPDPVLADGLAILADSDLRPQLGEIRPPCLIIHGEHDALMPLAAAQALAAALPAAELRVLGGSGHALPLSRPADCARLIGAFLQ
ncbi:alpha/beta fold hydrolase [Thauera aromatica]|uniref:alpha/beta fold hydrolase n=1 Tax=Thauera aromatica TaxID=59405 RepID=UPI001FFC8C58|nr:alpha/beta fold hydrolase [Thauera aromatica]